MMLFVYDDSSRRCCTTAPFKEHTVQKSHSNQHYNQKDARLKSASQFFLRKLKIILKENQVNRSEYFSKKKPLFEFVEPKLIKFVEKYRFSIRQTTV